MSAVSLIPAPASIGLLIWLGESILGISAAILITSPEPALSLEEQPSSLRRVTRLAVLLSIGSDLWEVDLLPTSNRLLTVTITALGYAAAIVWYFGEFVYLRRLALRIPDDALARRTRVVMWGFFAGTAMAGVVALTAVGAFGGGPVGTPVIGFVVIGCVGVVLVLVFLIAYVHMLYRYIRAFRTAIDLAVIAPYLKAPLSQGPQNPAR